MRIPVLLAVVFTTLSTTHIEAWNPPAGRRVVALPLDHGKIFFGWRYREADGLRCHYEIKRADDRTGPFTMAGVFRQGHGTCFIDSATVAGNTYYCYATTPSGMSRILEVEAVEQSPGCLSFPLHGGRTPHSLALGDLDGDLLFEVVLLSAGRGSSGGDLLAEALSVERGSLWRTALPNPALPDDNGPGLLVRDLDGDGSDEVVVGGGGKLTVLAGGKELDLEASPGMAEAARAAIRGGLSGKAAGPLELEWDGDRELEIASDGEIRRSGNGGDPATFIGQPAVAADILGDWRDELVTVDENAIRIYTSTIIIDARRPSPLDDPARRAAIGRGRPVRKPVAGN